MQYRQHIYIKSETTILKEFNDSIIKNLTREKDAEYSLFLSEYRANTDPSWSSALPYRELKEKATLTTGRWSLQTLERNGLQVAVEMARPPPVWAAGKESPTSRKGTSEWPTQSRRQGKERFISIWFLITLNLSAISTLELGENTAGWLRKAHQNKNVSIFVKSILYCEKWVII